MPDPIPQRPSWKEQLLSAYEAKAATNAAEANTPPATEAAAPSPESETPATVTSPYAKTPVDTPTPADESAPEEAAPLDADPLSEQEGDALPIATLKAQLRSGFNKKMKELDDKIKALEGKTGDSATASQKAQVLDALLQSPNPEQAIKSAREAMGISTSGQNTGSVLPARVMRQKFEELKLHPDVIEPIEDSLDAYLEAKLFPMLMPYVAWIQQQAQSGAQSEWSTLAQKYEGADEFKQQAYQLAGQAKIPLEKALRAVLPDEVLSAPKQKAVAAKVAASTVRANGVPKNNVGEANYETHKNALVRALLAKDRESGKNRFLENRITS